MLSYKEFLVLNALYNKEKGREKTPDLETLQLVQKKIGFKDLMRRGYINDKYALTEAGLVALEPYKVKNAVILAAGASTRFIPLGLEQPKGLYKAKGEKLIERQIEQLLAAGVNDITLVLGYKKEMFFYLREKYGVKFIFNPNFNTMNNIESLRLAQEIIGNSYICSSDDYFVDNPFNKYEYRSFYAGMEVEKKCSEIYAELDEDNRIVRLAKGKDRGCILLGQAYWNKAFATAYFEFVKADQEVGIYCRAFWEWLVMDKLEELPPFHFKKYKLDTIYEFDFFEDLRKFDLEYQRNTNSSIIRNIKLVFRCDEEDIVDFRNVFEGMTNTSFIFRIADTDYIYRHPGEGTESIISRRNEKKSLELAKKIGIDPTYIYEDVNEGWKISVFIPEFREPDYSNFEDSKKILAVLKQLHTSGLKVDYGMKPWEDALDMERMLIAKNKHCFEEFQGLKDRIHRLYEATLDDGIEKCLCHGDTYKPNWMIRPDGSVILIDWEYSGYSDPGIDIGYYIVDAMYDFDEAKRFIAEYLGQDYSEVKEFHFMAYTAIIAYYWFVWAMYRESCGAVMGEALYNWYSMAKKYAEYLDA